MQPPGSYKQKFRFFSLQRLVLFISADVMLSFTKTMVSAAASGALSAVSVFTADTDVKTSYGTQKKLILKIFEEF